MSKVISWPRFEALKRQATRARRVEPHLKRAQILDRIATAEGFSNWSLLARSLAPAVGEVAQPAPKPHEVRIFGFIGRIPGERKLIHEYVPSLKVPRHYAGLRGGARWQHFAGEHEGSVRAMMAVLRRGIEFMDATGLRPSRAWKRVFGRGYRLDGFDHTTIWLDVKKRYVVVTEPYIGAVEKHRQVSAWCEERGWQYETMTNGFGIWNPCRSDCNPDCRGHTRMIVMAPPNGGGDVRGVVEALKRARSAAVALEPNPRS